MKTEEAVVRTDQCPKCGKEARDGSAFCYNCGEAISSAGDIQPAEAQELSGANDIATPDESKKPAPGMKPPLKERRRPGTLPKKPKQVVWEAADEPNAQLIVVTAILAVFTILMIILAFYLR